jgi:hypothetical protein
MSRLEYAQPFNAFVQGRAARQDEDYANSRNALARVDAENAPAEAQRRNKLADLGVQQAEQGIQANAQELDANKAKQAYATLLQAKQSGNPKQFILQNVPDLVRNAQRQGMDLASMDDQAVAEFVDNMAGAMAGKAGIAPEAAPVQLETVEGPGGAILQRDPTTGALKQVVAPQKPDRFSEAQAAADRRAQEAREHATQLAESQRGFTAEQNDLNRQHQTNLKTETANVKQKVIEAQNNRAYQVYQAGISGLTKGLEGTNTGPIAGRMPAFTADQQIAAGSVAAMAPVLKSLFRGTGEGTFTDKDQDLLLAMIPTRTDEPEAKLGMANRQEAPAAAIEFLRANPQMKDAFQAKYGYLPDGI